VSRRTFSAPVPGGYRFAFPFNTPAFDRFGAGRLEARFSKLREKSVLEAGEALLEIHGLCSDYKS
jgi:hypothetical protein